MNICTCSNFDKMKSDELVNKQYSENFQNLLLFLNYDSYIGMGVSRKVRHG